MARNLTRVSLREISPFLPCLTSSWVSIPIFLASHSKLKAFYDAIAAQAGIAALLASGINNYFSIA